MKHFRRWGAAYILFLLFLGSVSGQAAFMLPNEGWHAFWAELFANWESEWIQLFLQAVLLLGAKHYLFKADADDQERLEAKVDAILERLSSHDRTD